MNLYISNLGFHIDESDLRGLFEPFGTVSSAKIILDRETGRSRGFGFVTMDSDSEANKAMESLNGYQLGGRAVSVTVARERESRPTNPTNRRW